MIRDCDNNCRYASASPTHCRLVDHCHGDAIKEPGQRAAPAGEYFFGRREAAHKAGSPSPDDCEQYQPSKGPLKSGVTVPEVVEELEATQDSALDMETD